MAYLWIINTLSNAFHSQKCQTQAAKSWVLSGWLDFHNYCMSRCTDLRGKSSHATTVSTSKEELISVFARFAKIEASNQRCSEFILRHLLKHSLSLSPLCFRFSDCSTPKHKWMFNMLVRRLFFWTHQAMRVTWLYSNIKKKNDIIPIKRLISVLSPSPVCDIGAFR